MGMTRYDKPSRYANRDKRWPALRLKALRRDDWRCVQCASRHRLQVDHIKPVRSHRELAFDLANLQVLCAGCHSRKTARELGRAPMTPERRAWRKAVRDLQCRGRD